jgi:hypothetical protein
MSSRNVTYVCVGRPKPSRKLSISRLVSSFNDSIQVDFLFVQLCTDEKTSVIFHMVDASTAYSETSLVISRDLLIAAEAFENRWILHHGAPISLSPDPEFNRKNFQNMLTLYGITYHARPARRHNKTGIVERKNGILRLILYHLNLEHKNRIDTATLLARATFVSNTLVGNRTVFSFEAVRGYNPLSLDFPAPCSHHT